MEFLCQVFILVCYNIHTMCILQVSVSVEKVEFQVCARHLFSQDTLQPCPTVQEISSHQVLWTCTVDRHKNVIMCAVSHDGTH